MVPIAAVGIVRCWGAWWRVALGFLIGALGLFALFIRIWAIVADTT